MTSLLKHPLPYNTSLYHLTHLHILGLCEDLKELIIGQEVESEGGLIYVKQRATLRVSGRGFFGALEQLCDRKQNLPGEADTLCLQVVL